MMLARAAKSLMCLALAAFALLVAYDNVVDFDSNYQFVKHVLSMDTTFPGGALRDRAITSPRLWTIGYAGIIAAEAATGLLFLIGGVSLLANIADPEPFERAKAWVVVAATLGFLTWFFGFMVVGGEWFQMWQSTIWNGQQAAFRFYVTILAVLIFVQLPERDFRY